MLIAVLMALALQNPAEPNRALFSSHVDGARWEFVVRDADLDACPVWQESADHPPLAPRAAARAAQALLRPLVEQADTWEQDEISLRPILGHPGAWVYLVRFLTPLPPAKPGTVGSSLRGQLSVVVLMDGRAVVPHRQALRE
jgi:hypothetical protein